MIYRVFVEQDRSDPERSRYSAFVPDIPNCFTSADSWEQLESMVQEAAALCIEMHGEHGRTYPAPTGFQFLVEVPMQ